jgi:hypothetical protein
MWAPSVNKAPGGSVELDLLGDDAGRHLPRTVHREGQCATRRADEIYAWCGALAIDRPHAVVHDVREDELADRHRWARIAISSSHR